MDINHAEEVNNTEIAFQDNKNWLLSLENYNWDDWNQQESDWLLEWDDDLIKKIKELPPVPRYRFILNQYHLPERKTSCTKFSAMNALWNDIGYEPTIEDIRRIEEKSKLAGRGWTGKARYRAGWVDVVRRDWNERNPDNEVASYLLTMFSDEFWAYLETGRCIVVSINVWLKYWADVLSDWKLDDMNFWSWWGHATVLYKESDWVVRVIDSVGTTKSWLLWGRTYILTYWQLKDMVKPKYVMQQNCHIFIPKKIVKMITTDVAEWQFYSEAVKWAIDNKITTEVEKFRPSDNMTRAEAITWLYRLAKKNEWNS